MASIDVFSRWHAELKILSTLFKRIPTLAPAAPIETLNFHHEVFVYVVEKLSVTC